MNAASHVTVAKGNPLWDFAVWAYAQPGVETACLSLQNRLNTDVNMVLFCAWLAYRGTPTTHLAAYVGAALKLSRQWQGSLVGPLRTCRENLKGVIESSSLVGNDRAAAIALRERIKQSELELEQLQLLAFHALVADSGTGGLSRPPAEQKDDALNNLSVYFAANDIRLDPQGQAHVMRILTVLFGA